MVFNQKLNKKYGFSMLELVVVMLIMGTLAGIVISKMGGSDVGAVKSSMKSDLRNTIRGMNSCYTDTLNYNSCVPTTNPVRFTTVPSERTLGNSIYVGVTTNGNTIRIFSSGTNNNFFGVSRYNTELGGYFKFNNASDSSISLFTVATGHPTLAP